MTVSKYNLLMTAALLVVSSAVNADFTVSDAWVRGVVKGQTTTGAFMTLKSTEDAVLISASSPVAKQVEIHEMKMQGEMMMMRPISELPVPANKPLELRPGGYHVMLIGLTKPIVTGEKVPVTLNFQSKDGKKGSIDVQAEVRELTANPQSEHKM
jgi:copper(I)-binding protein